MAILLEKKIARLSKGLKYLSLLGVLLFPLLTFIYWMLDLPEAGFLARQNWYVKFSDMPAISHVALSFKMRLLGFSIDLIPCVFFISILILLAKLFNQYERLQFFSKKNTQHIRAIAYTLFGYLLVFPIYAALRSYVFTSPGEKRIVVLFGRNDFKLIMISFAILLLAYISEAAHRLEEEITGLV
ncbi:MAG: DUF2975 domain-containing protein [Chlamydiales bacterium]